jgi:hypothetical protein
MTMFLLTPAWKMTLISRYWLRFRSNDKWAEYGRLLISALRFFEDDLSMYLDNLFSLMSDAFPSQTLIDPCKS